MTKEQAEELGILIVFLMGLTTGIPIGILLCEFFDHWSKQAAAWIMAKLGYRRDEIE